MSPFSGDRMDFSRGDPGDLCELSTDQRSILIMARQLKVPEGALK